MPEMFISVGLVVIYLCHQNGRIKCRPPASLPARRVVPTARREYWEKGGNEQF